MIPRRALIFLGAASLLFASSSAIEIRSPRGARSLAPPDSGVALFAGAFRPLLADLLWARLVEKEEAREYDEVVPLAKAIVAVDPHFERAWLEAALTVGIDIAAFEDDPDAVWRWRRQGVLLFEEGLRKNPGSWLLRFFESWFVEHDIARDRPHRDALEARFRADRALNPGSLSAGAFAAARLEEAHAIPGHAAYVDAVWRVAHGLAPEPGK